MHGIVELKAVRDDLVQLPQFTGEGIELEESDFLKVTPAVSGRIFAIIMLYNILNTLFASTVVK